MASSAVLSLFAIEGIPIVSPGDNLSALVIDGLLMNDVLPTDGDVIVVAQKIVSKAEGRIVDLRDVHASPRAIELAPQVEKDPRLVEVILRESHSVLRCRPGLIIVRHRLGYVMANAGVDHSNVESAQDEEHVLLLPEDSDASAEILRCDLHRRFDAKLAVIISDSVGRPWRNGTVGLALGCAGMPAVEDLRGRPDLHGRPLLVSETGLADMVASAGTLLMGEADQGCPVVLARGVNWFEPAGNGTSAIRPWDQDLFH